MPSEHATDAEGVVRLFYDLFNEQRFADAAALFSEDAVLEHAPLRRQQRGANGFLEFARMWTQAFPDAALAVDRIGSRDGVTFEIDLVGRGTHLGPLDIGGGGVFKATGTSATLRLRQILEIRDGRIVFSNLSFDLQDIIHQLVTVDVTKLLDGIRRIHALGEKLMRTSPDDVFERRNLIERLGRELDATRRTVRPYFNG
jgi:hypothetical protein